MAFSFIAILSLECLFHWLLFPHSYSLPNNCYLVSPTHPFLLSCSSQGWARSVLLNPLELPCLYFIWSLCQQLSLLTTPLLEVLLLWASNNTSLSRLSSSLCYSISAFSAGPHSLFTPKLLVFWCLFWALFSHTALDDTIHYNSHLHTKSLRLNSLRSLRPNLSTQTRRTILPAMSCGHH